MPRVALVEDDEVVRDVVVTILKKRGYEVEAFATLGDARRALSLLPPDLLISDIDLPDGNGLDLLRSLETLTGQRVPAIVLSARRQEEDFAQGFEAGAVDYLAKPFSREELLARCSVHLARAKRASMPRSWEPPAAGELAFGRYLIERELGRGGYGQVFLARDVRRGEERVALKVFAPSSSDQEEARLRFVRETYTLSSLRHPRIAVIHEVGAEAGRTFFAMEYVNGTSLRGLVIDRGLLGEGDVRLVARGVLEALVAVDAAGLVHRDIKPDNIMLRDGRVDQPVLIDFGLAKRPLDRGITAAEMLVGTPSYLSPEAILGREPDRRSDLFALGLALRFALAGVEIFPDLEGVALLSAIAHIPIPPPPVPLGAGFGELLASLTAIDPARRPRDAVAALEWLDSLAPVSPDPEKRGGAPRPHSPGGGEATERYDRLPTMKGRRDPDPRNDPAHGTHPGR